MINSSNDMYVNGEYLKNNPTWAVEDSPMKADVIYKLLRKNMVLAKKVIEVGCGAGGILEQLAIKSSTFSSLIGYDISPQAISLARSRENTQISFRNEDFLSQSEETADLLLIIDVLEHVDNFYQFLRSLKARSNYFVFHVPLDLCGNALLKPHILLQQRQAVGHIHYFSKEMVFWFLNDTGYQIIDWVYTKPVVDISPPDSFKRAVKKIFRNTFFAFKKDMSAKLFGGYSIMILAK